MLSVNKIYDLEIIKIENGGFIFSRIFLSYLKQETFQKYLIDSTDYSIHEFDKLFVSQNWKNGFVLYRKYSRKDVFRILNVSVNPIAQNVGGYLVSPDNAHCPIFVNYHKEEGISESTKYEDEFVNNKEFDWMSKSNRKIDSKDVQSILGKNGDIRRPLFIKKNNDEGMDFYYMGEVNPELNKVEQTTMTNDKGKQIPVVKIRFNLENPVTAPIYTYLQENRKIRDSSSENNGKTVPLVETTGFEKELLNPIPFYNFYAAAGTFSEMQSEKNFSLIEGVGKSNLNGDYFACKIVGESMNRVIPNGSICLFKANPVGSRNGKIVLIENMDIQDQDFNSAFTIKTYSSEKVFSGESYRHKSIVLRPNSFDDSYEDIIVNEESALGMRVVGEFIKILSN